MVTSDDGLPQTPSRRSGVAVAIGGLLVLLAGGALFIGLTGGLWPLMLYATAVGPVAVVIALIMAASPRMSSKLGAATFNSSVDFAPVPPLAMADPEVRRQVLRVIRRNEPIPDEIHDTVNGQVDYLVYESRSWQRVYRWRTPLILVLVALPLIGFIGAVPLGDAWHDALVPWLQLGFQYLLWGTFAIRQYRLHQAAHRMREARDS